MNKGVAITTPTKDKVPNTYTGPTKRETKSDVYNTTRYIWGQKFSQFNQL